MYAVYRQNAHTADYTIKKKKLRLDQNVYSGLKKYLQLIPELTDW